MPPILVTQVETSHPLRKNKTKMCDYNIFITCLRKLFYLKPASVDRPLKVAVDVALFDVFTLVIKLFAFA